MKSKSAEILKQIEQGELLLLPFDANYYISKKGEIYSLNKTRPKLIKPTQQSSGEYFVALYVPNIEVFSLAYLMLVAFLEKPDGEVFPCYHNNDPTDLSLNNLYWGDSIELFEWKSRFSLNKSKKIMASIENSDSLDEQDITYYCNRSFLYDISIFVVQISRLILGQNNSKIDSQILRKVFNDLTEIISVSVLNYQKLQSIFTVEFEDSSITQLFSEYEKVIFDHRSNYVIL
jgi:hypothetical protein